MFAQYCTQLWQNFRFLLWIFSKLQAYEKGSMKFGTFGSFLIFFLLKYEHCKAEKHISILLKTATKSILHQLQVSQSKAKALFCFFSLSISIMRDTVYHSFNVAAPV